MCKICELFVAALDSVDEVEPYVEEDVSQTLKTEEQQHNVEGVPNIKMEYVEAQWDYVDDVAALESVDEVKPYIEEDATQTWNTEKQEHNVEGVPNIKMECVEAQWDHMDDCKPTVSYVLNC